ncbi:hypothetical protein [Sphingobium sp. EM0848]|uniref:hypothetical protein n=1 Tax=Sphingobium sp. EM0848 TaxID=2743473 RepID=UPI00159C34C0|nr:hypothetical protein [Sphingobium sp. EM0848]
MKSLLLFAMVAQYQMPPVPAPPPAGGEALESELGRMAQRYRTQCYSEKAIKIMIESTRRARTTVSPNVAAIRATYKELADAAYAEPFDKNRMVLAMRASAQAQAQADSMVHYPDNSIAILEQLPKPDQVIFARLHSGATPVFPTKPCS